MARGISVDVQGMSECDKPSDAPFVVRLAITRQVFPPSGKRH
jgi:hypothetical protein